MTLLELRTLLRSQLDDPIETDDTDTLWKDTELTAYINRALVEACMRTKGLIVDSTTASVCEIDVVEDTSEYSISPKILMISRIRYGTENIVLRPIGHRNLDRGWGGHYQSYGNYNGFDSTNQYRYGSQDFLTDQWQTDKGTPTQYVVDLQQRKITLDRIPDADTTMTLTIYRLPLTALSADGDIPEIDEQYHYDLTYGAKKLAYEKRDSEAHNTQFSQLAEAEFTRAFGMRPDAGFLNHTLYKRQYEARAHFT